MASPGTRVLAAFIDGLRVDSLAHMPFVRSFGHSRAIRTELGYSITCHPSMYTGVWPEQHLSWFIWQRAREGSPFQWLHSTGLDRLPDSPYVKYPLYRATEIFKGNTAWFSIPFPAYFPLKDWHHFDVTEKKMWNEPGFNKFPTIFDHFRAHGVSMNIVGMNKRAPGSGPSILSAQPEFAEFTYLFFGDIDPLSHAFCQDSPRTRERLAIVDQAIERWYRAAVADGQEPLFLLWSDHGHVRIEERVPIDDVFRKHHLEMSDFIHVTDANYARFWFRDDAERARVERVLPDLGQGFVVTPEVAERYHVRMPDNRFGDLIYYLEAPAVFDKGTINVLGRRLSAGDMSMHGYSPEVQEVSGTLVANRPIRLGRQPILQDIAPTLLREFRIPVPDYMVGDPLW